MNKKILSFILALVIAVSSCVAVMAASATVSVNLTIGVGETKSLDNYLKDGAAVSKWTNNAASVAKVTGNSVKGIKEGTAVIKGTGSGVTYVFKVKVLKNFTGYQDLENKIPGQEKNSRGQVVNRYKRTIVMGVKDSVNVTNLLATDKKYYNYNWVYSDKGIINFKGGKITAQKSGIVCLKAIEKTNIYEFYITVADKHVAKNISVRKNTLTNLGNYIGDASNYVFDVQAGTNAAVTIKDNQYIASGDAKGTSILTCENTAGGTSYTFIVNIIG